MTREIFKCPSFHSAFAFIFFVVCSVGAQNTNLPENEKTVAFRRIQQSAAAIAGQNFHARFYRCEWKINPAVSYIRGRVRCSFKIISDTASVLSFDFSSQMTVDSVRFRGNKIPSAFSGTNILRIQLPVTLAASEEDSLSIYYKGSPANSGFGSFNRQFHAGQPIIWTMSCPYAASDWWPCVQNHRQKADSIEQIITVPANCRAAGNGKLMQVAESDSGRTFYWKHRHPIAAYLVATAVTNYEAFSNRVQLPSMAPGDSMEVLNFVYPEALNSARFNLPKIIPVLRYYDSLVAPYPFRHEKYGHAQFGWGGGMEHQTMSFMTNFSVSLQAHELAHQWFGNHITCRSWRDVWLNEGWATYMAALAEQKMGTASFSAWLNTTQGAVRASAGGSVWVDDTSDINRIFDYRLTYRKGALLLHMLRWELGDSAFWAGVRSYQADPQLVYGYATTRQFLHHLEQASGKNLAVWEQEWFYGQGYPNLQFKLTAEGSGLYRLRIGQNGSHSSVPFFHLKIPVRISGGGQDSTLIFFPDSSGQEYLFSLPFEPASLVFDPQKWLLAKSTVQVLTRTENRRNVPPPIKIQPNPFSDSLYLLAEGGPFVLRFFDEQGREVLRQAVSESGQQRIATRSLLPGKYILLWEQGRNSGAEKIIKRME